MTDQDALSVTYRGDRGEPRAPHKKGASWEGRGDCVDCRQCVAVCPQGIDIRDGDQLECINCALCIDACDSVMRKVGRPTGLIAYDTHGNVERRAAGQKARLNLIRPRTVLYAVLMVLIGALMFYQLTHRSTLQLDVIRDRSPAFVRLADGSVRNDYTLKLINMAPRARTLVIRLSGLDGAHLVGADLAAVEGGGLSAVASGDSVTTVRVHVVAPSTTDPGQHRVQLNLADTGQGETTQSAVAFMMGESP
jgi:cytochrome c oxidase accessory protein FixG